MKMSDQMIRSVSGINRDSERRTWYYIFNGKTTLMDRYFIDVSPAQQNSQLLFAAGYLGVHGEFRCSVRFLLCICTRWYEWSPPHILFCTYLIIFFWSVLYRDILGHCFTRRHFSPLLFCRKQGQNHASPSPNHWKVTTLVCRWSTWSHPSVPSRCSSRSASVTSKRLVSPVYPSTATTNNRLDHITHTDGMKIKLHWVSKAYKKKEEAFLSACSPECVYYHTWSKYHKH